MTTDAHVAQITEWSRHLPAPATERIAVRVTPDALRQVRGGSPWVYDGSITSASRDGASGDLAVVFDDKRRFAAIGLWDPGSPIRLKVLHRGAPRTIDLAFFVDAIRTAVERRSTLAADPDTNAYRCVHGENDGLPGLVVDRYAATVVVKIYTDAWWPHLGSVVAAVDSVLAPERIVLRTARNVGPAPAGGLADGITLVGDPPDAPVRFRERGLVMEADVVHGHKTGHFLDQRDNRALVRSLANGATVLDVFASTGGFALAAAAGGATSVHLVDVSAPALRVAERNLSLNAHIRAVRECAVRITTGDAFAVLDDLRKKREQYDVVVLDPPSFAQRRDSVEGALRAYGRLTRGALDVLVPGGTLVQASCSSRVSEEQLARAVYGAAESAGVELHEIRRTGHAIDHPIGFEQGAYLKAIYARRG